MPRPPEFANWPFDFAWWFLKSSLNDPQVPQAERGPGCVRLAHLDSGQAWNIHVRVMDEIARKYDMDRDTLQGGMVQFGDGTVHEIAYRRLDDDADAMQARKLVPHPVRTPFTLIFKDSVKMEQVPMDWWEARVVEHINRRKAMPVVPLDMGNGQVVNLALECFDALCKDFSRRRGDFTAAGWWPELLMADYGQMQGPKPVDGRANALGQGAQVMQGQQPPGGQPGQAAHPGLEHEGLV
ncbi:MAG: hypothetical protein ACREVZ_15790 [Burkholderiales bacterium]